MIIGIDIRNIGKKRTGDEVVFFNLAKNLAQIDKNNSYLLFTDIADEKVLSGIRTSLAIGDAENFKIISLPAKNRFVWNSWALPRYLSQNPVDIYLTQYITPFFVPKKISIATIVHDVSFKAYRQYIQASDLFFLDILLPISFRRAGKIICVSKFTRDEVLKYYEVSDKKVDWIHNAVGENFQKEVSQTELNSVRIEYNLPEKFILYMGTLQPRKNLPMLIEAYANLPEEIKNSVKLVLAGGKGHNYDKNIEMSVKKFSLERDVLFPGYIPEEDKPAIFKLSQVFCNPSFYEGFGITVLEAMAMGIPIIASDIPPHHEAAENSIIYCRPENAADLTEKLNSVLINRVSRDEQIQKELLQAQKFSWQKSAQRLLEIFENIHKN